MNKIKSIVRYPIKGLSGENLENITLEKNQVLPGDREFAFARSYVTYEENNPMYLRKTNFLALVKEEKLAKLETKFDPESRKLLIKLDNKIVINEILNELTYDHTKIIMSLEEMERYKFKRILIDEVENNWKNLRKDLEAEGVLFE